MKTKFYFIFTLLLTTLVVNSQDFTYKQKIVSPYRFDNGFFGSIMAISGNYAIIGVPYDPMDENNTDSIHGAGAAYIYMRNGSGDWIFRQKLTAPVRDKDEFFGYSVAISGNTAIVGACGEDYDPNEQNYQSYAGAAYIYELNVDNNWVKTQKIVASDRSSDDLFGAQVAVSGNIIAVSATGVENPIMFPGITVQTGAVYIFERDSINQWIETQTLTLMSVSDYAGFGSELSINGNTLVAIAKDYLSMSLMKEIDGHVNFYEKNTSSSWWDELGQTRPDGIVYGDGYGNSAAVYGDYIMIGAPGEDKDGNNGDSLHKAGAVYIYTADTSGWGTNYQKITANNRNPDDRFGSSVSMYGNTAIIGASYGDKDNNGLDSLKDAGLAYIFELNNNRKWVEKQIISAPDRHSEDHFGSSAAISGDYILFSSPYHDFDLAGDDSISNAGAVYIYERCNNDVSPVTGNIIENGSFEDCILPPWDLFCSATDTVIATCQIIDGACIVMPHRISADSTFWHIQLEQPLSPAQLLDLEENETYRLTFTAWSEEDNRPCHIYFGQNETPYEVLLEKIVTLNTLPHTFRYTFKMSSVFPSMKLSFDTGNKGSWACFDDISIAKYDPSEVNGPVTNSIGIYPNPATNFVKVTISGPARVQLINSIGVPVNEGFLQNNEITFYTSGLPDGIYIIRITRNDETSSRKIIIQ
ncbi:MAG: T9SS type A sorting domain-containing protein [Bacteroidales bacterium]|nr:T9SS type A sorting domain-containing protein [Bacteroidales bacterium]